MAFDLIFAMFDNVLFFIFFIIAIFMVIGWFSGQFSVGVFAGFLMFINIAVQQDNVLLTNLLYLAMVGILFFAAFRLYGFAFSGGESAEI